jgi:toxin FitB
MNIVDSSGWLEYFADETNADFFASPIESVAELIVPTIGIYEVFKRIRQQRSESEALNAIAQMQQGQVVDLDTTIALNAADLSISLKLPLADSVMLATARFYDATLWTQDAHFRDLEGIRYIEK